MAQSLNGKPVILNETGTLRSGDVLVLADFPMLIVVERNGQGPGIFLKPVGSGFEISLSDFAPGQEFISEATGTLSGKTILALTVANRLAELNGRAVYVVSNQISEV